jgi:1-aminocyclopropane-1-carboxylate deaminase
MFNQEIKIFNSTITLAIKREDLLHPFVSGNKFRKLKYNIIQAKKENQSLLITFGGAFSNHIAAVAFACQGAGIKSIGVIRGDELGDKIHENATLTFAKKCGMQFEFVSREEYQEKTKQSYLELLKKKYGKHYLLPEGGANELAIKGCEEILDDNDASFDYVCCAIGTGGTISGIINSARPNQKILGFPALKGDFLTEEITKFAKNKNWKFISDYHFGGYAKVTPELIQFMNEFYVDTKIPLDPVYTSKMVFGVLDLIEKKYFPDGSKILLIHTGGLQGIAGMNTVLKKKKMTQISYL